VGIHTPSRTAGRLSGGPSTPPPQSQQCLLEVAMPSKHECWALLSSLTWHNLKRAVCPWTYSSALARLKPCCKGLHCRRGQDKPRSFWSSFLKPADMTACRGVSAARAAAAACQGHAASCQGPHGPRNSAYLHTLPTLRCQSSHGRQTPARCCM